MDNQGASEPSISISLSFTFGSGPATNLLPALSWYPLYFGEAFIVYSDAIFVWSGSLET